MAVAEQQARGPHQKERPVNGALEAVGLHAGPERGERQRGDERRLRREQPASEQRPERPEEHAVGIVRLDVIDLRDEPDVRAEEDHAEQQQRRRKLRRVAALGKIGDAICRPHAAEEDRKLAEFRNDAPVRGEEADDAAPEQQRPEDRERRRKIARPAGVLRRRLLEDRPLGPGPDPAPLDPAGQLAAQPFQKGVGSHCSRMPMCLP